MSDRDVTIYLSMKASEIEATRAMTAVLAKFPARVWILAKGIEELLAGDVPHETVVEKLPPLLAGLIERAGEASAMTEALKPLICNATFIDREGKEGVREQ